MDYRDVRAAQRAVTIDAVQEFYEALARGAWADGGYPLYFVCDDGEALSFDAARENAGLIAEAIRDGYGNGWCVIAVEVNWEDGELFCAHTGERIPSAYAD